MAKKGYTDAFQQPEESPSGTITEQIFGKTELPEAGRQVAKPIQLSEIKPDPTQPRREIPLIVRQSVARDGGIEAKDKDRPSILMKRWVQLAEDASGQKLDLATLLKMDGDGLDEERTDIPLYDDLMKLIGLAASIQRNGLINPITVVQQAPTLYHIETGERRFLAHVLLAVTLPEKIRDKFYKIPAHLVSESNVWRQAEENASRKPLNAVGTARQLGLLIMDIYRGTDGVVFTPYDQLVLPGESDRPYYAQVSNGSIYRVPKGQGEKILQSTGLKSKAQFAHYRNLLNIPDEMWLQADAENWTEFKIRTLINPPQEQDTFTAVNLSPENRAYPASPSASPFTPNTPSNHGNPSPLPASGQGSGGEVSPLPASDVGSQNAPSHNFQIGAKVHVDNGPDIGMITAINGNRITVTLPTTASASGVYPLTTTADHLTPAQTVNNPGGWIGQAVRFTKGGITEEGIVQQIVRMRPTPTAPLADMLVVKGTHDETWHVDPLTASLVDALTKIQHSFKVGDSVTIMGSPVIGRIADIDGDKICVIRPNPSAPNVNMTHWVAASRVQLAAAPAPAHTVRVGNETFAVGDTVVPRPGAVFAGRVGTIRKFVLFNSITIAHVAFSSGEGYTHIDEYPIAKLMHPVAPAFTVGQIVDCIANEYTGRSGEIVRTAADSAFVQFPDDKGSNVIVQLPYAVLQPSAYQSYNDVLAVSKIMGYENTTPEASPADHINQGRFIDDDEHDRSAGYDPEEHGDMTVEEYSDRQRSLALIKAYEIEMQQQRGYGQFSATEYAAHPDYALAREFLKFVNKNAGDYSTLAAQTMHLLKFSPEIVRSSLEVGKPHELSEHLANERRRIFAFMEQKVIAQLDAMLDQINTDAVQIYKDFFDRS